MKKSKEIYQNLNEKENKVQTKKSYLWRSTLIKNFSFKFSSELMIQKLERKIFKLRIAYFILYEKTLDCFFK